MIWTQCFIFCSLKQTNTLRCCGSLRPKCLVPCFWLRLAMDVCLCLQLLFERLQMSGREAALIIEVAYPFGPLDAAFVSFCLCSLLEHLGLSWCCPAYALLGLDCRGLRIVLGHDWRGWRHDCSSIWWFVGWLVAKWQSRRGQR